MCGITRCPDYVVVLPCYLYCLPPCVSLSREAALEPIELLQLLATLPEYELLQCPKYIPEESKWANGRCQTGDKWTVVLAAWKTYTHSCIGRQMVTKLHKATHLGTSKAAELLRPRWYIPQLDNLVKDVSKCTCVPLAHKQTPRGIERLL